jgi:hypothetical protein
MNEIERACRVAAVTCFEVEPKTALESLRRATDTSISYWITGAWDGSQLQNKENKDEETSPNNAHLCNSSLIWTNCSLNFGQP